MPNWAEGNLKIRGDIKDVKSFLENEFEKNEEYNSYWLKGSRRVFYPAYDDWNYSSMNEIIDDLHINEKTNQCSCSIILKSAWCWLSKESKIDNVSIFIDFSKKYNLDFKMSSYEQGMQFWEKWAVINGVSSYHCNEKIEDWNWDVENSNWGG